MKADRMTAAEPGRLQDELDTLIDIGKALTSHLTRENVYKVVMDKIGKLLEPQAWTLLLVDPLTEELCFEIVVAPAADQLLGKRLVPGEGFAGWIGKNGRPLLLPDLSKDKRYALQVDPQLIGFKAKSLLSVPLTSRERISGMIQLFNGQGKASFTCQDQRILETIADFTAIAIENSRLLEQVRDLTITDDLTGLYNSRHFQTLCDYELERASRYDHELSLVFLDLDYFKQVNDRFGHLTGSRLLKEVGQLFRESIRKVDHAARYGGDEFVFLLPSTCREGACRMAENLLTLLRDKVFFGDNQEPIKVTASIGICTYPTAAANQTELVKRADEAMYRIKRTGRDGIHCS